MPVTIDGSNTPTAGGVGYGDGTELAFTTAGTAGQVLTSNGAGAPTWGSSTTNLATDVTGTLGVSNGGTGATSLTANNVLLGNGTSAVQFVAPGTTGNVLTSNGTTWTSAAAAGGATVFLGSVTASSSSTLDLFNLFSSTYDNYLLVGNGIYKSLADNTIYIRVRTGTTTHSDSQYTSNYNGGVISGQNTGRIFEGALTASSSQFAFNMYLTNINSTTQYKGIYGYGATFSSGTVTPPSNFNVVYSGNTNALTGIQFLGISGTIVSGTIRLYGIKNS